MRLSEIPSEKLSEIEAYVKSQKDKTLSQLREEIKQKFGIEISESQISKIRKGLRVVEVYLPEGKQRFYLPEETIRELLDLYGDITVAMREFARTMPKYVRKPPEEMRPFIAKYAGDIYEWKEWIQKVMEFYNVDEKRADEMLVEMMKLGYLKRTEEPGIKYQMLRFPVPADIGFLLTMMMPRKKK
jgi:hypothetical protein